MRTPTRWRTEVVCIRLPSALLEVIDALAEDGEETRTAWIRRAIADRLRVLKQERLQQQRRTRTS